MILLIRGGGDIQETLTGVEKITTRDTGVRTLITAYDKEDKPSGEIDLNIHTVELLPER